MATMQQVRSQNKQGQWASIFPNEQVTETQSTLFVKKLLAVAVSSISYLRALFPENAFGDRCLEDMNLKILRDDSNCPEAYRVIQWIRGCFDALEKKYLRAVLIGIYEDPEDPDTVIEQYSFKFAYGDGGGIDIYRNGAKVSAAKTDQDTKKATIRLLSFQKACNAISPRVYINLSKEMVDLLLNFIRTIVLLSQTLSPLPDDVMMTMKLLYYDEVTPEDYNPPGFKPSDCEHFDFKDEPMNIRVGDVATQYHAFKLRIKTLNHDLQEANENEEPCVVPGDEKVMQQATEGVNVGASLYKDKEFEADSNEENIDPNIPGDEKPSNNNNLIYEENSQIPDDEAPGSIEGAASTRSNTRISTPASSIAPESEDVVTKCPCGVHEDDGLMILCAVCNTWQHAICFAILKPEEAPEVHYCVDCASNTDNQCTDVMLSSVEHVEEVKELCLWRRALVAVLEAARVLPANLAKRLGVSTPVASRLLKRMESEGFLNSGGKAKRFGKIVQKEEIQNHGYKKYFYNSNVEQDEGIVLVTEKASNLQLNSKKEAESEHSKGLKRKSIEVISKKKQDLRFELSNSQQSPSQEVPMKRRKKTSVSTEPMHV